MGAVYSTRFMNGFMEPGIKSYTIPAGYVAVIRDIDVCATGTLSTPVPGVEVDIGGTVFAQLGLPFALQNLSYGWRGRQIANAGEVLNVRTSVGGWYYSVSGYLLTLP